MRDRDELEALLRDIDGDGYKAYKRITGTWRFPDFALHVDHVQGDPYAAPTRVRVELAASAVGLSPSAFENRSRALGTSALLARSFAAAARAASRPLGTGKSGEIRMEAPGQEVLPQTALLVRDDGSVEARFTVGLPARGRRALGRAAAELMGATLTGLVRGTLLAGAHDPHEVERHAAANEDADHLRAALAGRGLVAFVADGASLPRRSGVDDRPLEGPDVVPFSAPTSLRVDIDVPNAGTLAGMGIPRGVTLVVGGGFHGKSTLLRAIETGVYNHRPGDGREQVVTVPEAVKVRADDGRAVARVDISGFIDGLPLGRSTERFDSPNASGSTSQAAAIVEALECAATVLLVDEDTSATNFMIRDERMQALVHKDDEPITPFVDRVRELYERLEVSSVLVLGGSGDYLDVADTVIAMRRYRPHDVTREAAVVAAEHPTGRTPERAAPLGSPSPRVPRAGSVDARRGRRDRYVRVPDDRTLLLGTETIDLASVEQLVSRPQIRAIGYALAYAGRALVDGRRSVREIVDEVTALVAREGLDALDERLPGDLAAFRGHELAAALDRARSLEIV